MKVSRPDADEIKVGRFRLFCDNIGDGDGKLFNVAKPDDALDRGVGLNELSYAKMICQGQDVVLDNDSRLNSNSKFVNNFIVG